MYMQDRPFPRDPRPERYREEPAQAPRCFHCQYELTGFAVGQTCPECGNEIRTLYGSRKLPLSVKVSLWCGGLGLLALFPCGCLFPLTGLLWLALSVAGLAAALVARAEIRTNPQLYRKSSIAVARTGFWLCVPGVVVLILIVVGVAYTLIIGV